MKRSNHAQCTKRRTRIYVVLENLREFMHKRFSKHKGNVLHTASIAILASCIWKSATNGFHASARASNLQMELFDGESQDADFESTAKIIILDHFVVVGDTMHKCIHLSTRES